MLAGVPLAPFPLVGSPPGQLPQTQSYGTGRLQPRPGVGGTSAFALSSCPRSHGGAASASTSRTAARKQGRGVLPVVGASLLRRRRAATAPPLPQPFVLPPPPPLPTQRIPRVDIPPGTTTAVWLRMESPYSVHHRSVVGGDGPIDNGHVERLHQVSHVFKQMDRLRKASTRGHS